MPVEASLNHILKEMWRIDEKTDPLTDAEKEFYNEHLSVIQEYYEKNDSYWRTKHSL